VEIRLFSSCRFAAPLLDNGKRIFPLFCVAIDPFPPGARVAFFFDETAALFFSLSTKQFLSKNALPLFGEAANLLFFKCDLPKEHPQAVPLVKEDEGRVNPYPNALGSFGY